MQELGLSLASGTSGFSCVSPNRHCQLACTRGSAFRASSGGQAGSRFLVVWFSRDPARATRRRVLLAFSLCLRKSDSSVFSLSSKPSVLYNFVNSPRETPVSGYVGRGLQSPVPLRRAALDDEADSPALPAPPCSHGASSSGGTIRAAATGPAAPIPRQSERRAPRLGPTREHAIRR